MSFDDIVEAEEGREPSIPSPRINVRAYIVIKPDGKMMTHTFSGDRARSKELAEIGSAKLKWSWFKEQGYRVMAMDCIEVVE